MALFTSARNSTTALAVAAALTFAAAPQISAQEPLPWQSQQSEAQQGSARSGTYSPPMSVGANDSYRPDGQGYEAAPSRAGDAYRADDEQGNSGNSSGRGDSFSDPAQGANAPNSDGRDYGQPYSPPPQTYDDAARDPGAGADPRQSEGFEQTEILGAGHRFFGSISGGIANAVEYVFKSQGRPNGYILGEDAGGAFIVGLRYGEGTLYTKDAGEHRVYWQGPSLGYDAGGDGSKTMVLVYNMRDPSEIYERFGGVQGAAYLVGGVSVQVQKYNDVTLAVIRSGVGLRLGANVGYLKYTRSPTWNPL